LDTTADRWLRLRESGGTIYADTSPDGMTWTNRLSVADPFPVTAVHAFVGSDTWSAQATGSLAKFDNFNTGGGVAPLSALRDDFNAGVGAQWVPTNPARVSADAGGMTVTHTATPDWTYVSSAAMYDFTGSSAYVQVTDFGNQSLPS